MLTFDLKSWARFRDFASRYAKRERERRAQWIFRGQSNADWGLTPTLDRQENFESNEVRNRRVDELLNEFRREAIRLDFPGASLPNSEGFELLARHYGLPSPLTDWTESIYIAAFFAFDEVRETEDHRVAMFAIDRAKLPAESPEFDIFDEIELLRFNRRAWHQRGVFVRLQSADRSLEELLGDALYKFELPATAAREALVELDEMTINRSYLFSDGEGAARTAAWRVFGEGETT